MAKTEKERREERRRFQIAEGKKRENWTEEQRQEFITKSEALRPFIEHLTTPAPTAKKKSFFGSLPIVED